MPQTNEAQPADATNCPDSSTQPASQSQLKRRFHRRVLVLPAFTAVLLAFFALLLTNAPAAQAQALRPNLRLDKFGPLSAVIGNQVAYTLLLSNIGTATANNITITEQTPPGLTFVSFGGACSGSTCNIASMAAFATPKTIRVTYTIPSNYDVLARPIITNTASVTSSTPESSYSNNTGTWGLLAVSVADLQLTKTANSDIVAAGEDVTYTLSITNLGPSQAISLSLGELLTPTLPFITGTTGACNFLLTGTIALCGNLPVGANQIITAVYHVPSDFVSPTVRNGALASSLSIDPVVLNNVATKTITITHRADVSITKEAPAMVVPGTDAVFTLTVANLGPSDATTVTVNDAGFNGLTSTNGAPCAGGFPCDLGFIKPLSSTQIVLTFTIPATFTETEIVNLATATSTVTDEVEINNSSTVTVPVVQMSALDVTKSGPATAVPGTLITYTVTVTNNGPSDAREVTLTDADPISMTEQGNPCVAGVCSLVDLPVGVSTTLTLTFSSDPFARGTVTNTASVTSTGTPTPVVATAATDFTPEVDLAVIKSDGVYTAAFGSPLTYTIVMTNNGPSGVDGATISDTLPAPLNGASWACVAVSPDACSPANGSGNVSTQVRLAPGSAATITVTGLLATASAGTPLMNETITNVVTVAAPLGVTETASLNDIYTDTTDLYYLADLYITKTAIPSDTIAPGELLTYVVVVGNAGPSDAQKAFLFDWLPASLYDTKWGCEAGAGAQCSTIAGVGDLTGVPVTLTPGSLMTVTITGTLNFYARGSIFNLASIWPNDAATDPNKDNNTASAEVEIQSKAFIGIGKTDWQTTAVPGTQVVYVITLTNEGPSMANGMLHDIFPPALENPVWSWDYFGKAQVLGDVSAIMSPTGVLVDMYPNSGLTLTVTSTLQLTATGWLTNEVEFAIGEDGCRIDVNGLPGSNIQGICDLGLKSNIQSIKECREGPGSAPSANIQGEGCGPEPKPIINTNPITRAIDVDEITPALVTGKIYQDMDGNGVFDAGEPPLPGVQVVITGNAVSAVTVVADASGLFTATVPPGAFSLGVVAASVPAGYELTSANDVQNGVAAAGNNATVPIGYQAFGAVRGVTFNDINGNNTQEAGEPVLPNVVVTLSNSAPPSISAQAVQAVLTTTSDASGLYTFTHVATGGYTINAAAPLPHVNTTPLPQNIGVAVNEVTVFDIGFQHPGAVVITKQAQTSGANNILGADRLITYTLLITNIGGGMLDQVLVTDTLEAYLQFVSGSATPAPYLTSPLAWQLGELMPGQGVTIQFAVLVKPEYNGTIANMAVVGGRQFALTPSNEVLVNTSPTAITLLWFTAQRDGDAVNLAWATSSEVNTFGFNVMRRENGSSAPAVKVNGDNLIPAGEVTKQYSFIDTTAEKSKGYTYWLQEIEKDPPNTIDYLDRAATVQPVSGQAVNSYRVFVPLAVR